MSTKIRWTPWSRGTYPGGRWGRRTLTVPFIADDLFINFDDARSAAGLEALHSLAAKTQVIFLSHQEHLLPVVRSLFPEANVETLTADASE